MSSRARARMFANGAALRRGLDFPGNETTTTLRGLYTLSPPAAYDMTYIWRAYPKGPKSGATNPAYWTAFFWGNYGDFGNFGNGYTYYGAHPYPFDGPSLSTGQNWEISVNYGDVPPNEGTNGGASVPSNTNGAWNRWYTQVFRAYINGGVKHHDFIWDWDLFVSSGGTDGVFGYSHSNAFPNPPTPSIVFGQAAPDASGLLSWGGWPGYEEFKGILRGFQVYASRVGAVSTGSASVSGGNHPTLANLANVTSEIATPGSTTSLWYLNLDPTTTDIADKSGAGHHFSWAHATNRPNNWTG